MPNHAQHGIVEEHPRAGHLKAKIRNSDPTETQDRGKLTDFDSNKNPFFSGMESMPDFPTDENNMYDGINAVWVGNIGLGFGVCFTEQICLGL